MPVYPPGFSERVFEFSFNAEYANKHKATLAGAPRIPTQNAEKWLGYDVEFELHQRGGAIHSVALQHKVSRYVDGVGLSNGHFFHTIGGPYFAFHLDTDQYNLIEAVASSGLPGVDFFYCAPLFTGIKNMNSHYLANCVETKSAWFDVSGLGPITDDDRHTIVYSQDGAQAYMFSENPVKVPIVNLAERRAERSPADQLDKADIQKIYNRTFDILEDYWPKLVRRQQAGVESSFKLPHKLPVREKRQNVENIALATGQLFGRYFGLSWLVEARK